MCFLLSSLSFVPFFRFITRGSRIFGVLAPSLPSFFRRMLHFIHHITPISLNFSSNDSFEARTRYWTSSLRDNSVRISAWRSHNSSVVAFLTSMLNYTSFFVPHSNPRIAPDFITLVDSIQTETYVLSTHILNGT